jgi:hypothetical protein
MHHEIVGEVNGAYWDNDGTPTFNMYPGYAPINATAGSFLSRIKHAVTAPVSAIANIAERGALAPFAAAQRVANAVLPGMPGGGGGGAGPQISPMPDPALSDPGSDGASDPNADSAGNFFTKGPRMHRHHLHHRHPAAMTGFEMPQWLRHPIDSLEHLNPFSHPAGELLVSAVPGGVAAAEAHKIATKALKNGTLKPEHLKKAGSLASAARGGHKGSIKKIAQIKSAAGKGNPHAEVALDRLKLADSIQRGGTIQHSGMSSIKHTRNVGLAAIRSRLHIA